MEMPRLYSIAAKRYGKQFDSKTTTLCVRCASYWDSEKVRVQQIPSCSHSAPFADCMQGTIEVCGCGSCHEWLSSFTLPGVYGSKARKVGSMNGCAIRLYAERRDAAKKGICSNFLRVAKPGDEITMTGEQPGRACC
jgi:hypothetical protein